MVYCKAQLEISVRTSKFCFGIGMRRQNGHNDQEDRFRLGRVSSEYVKITYHISDHLCEYIIFYCMGNREE